MRKIIKFIKNSTVHNNHLKNICNLTLILDCQTRWTSLFNSLDRFLNILTSIETTLKQFKHNSLLRDLDVGLEELRNSLKLFKNATEILSEDNCNFQESVNLFDWLLLRLEDDNSDLNIQFLNSLKTRLKNFELYSTHYQLYKLLNDKNYKTVDNEHRLESELNRIGFFSDIQFGFKTGVSTNDAIDKLINDFKKARKFKYALLVSFDASGAFDSINWNVIINNLIKSNVDNSYVKLAQSLLVNRKIIVDDKVIISSKGCPQGGRASPLLWRIGSNNLITELDHIDKTKPTAFADDTAVIIFDDNLVVLKKKLKQIVNVITNWCNSAEIQLNDDKTEIMSIGKKTIDNVNINNKLVKTTKSLKYLGIKIDNKLKFKQHIQYLEDKLKKLLFRVDKMCWLNNNLELKYKLKIYKNVFLAQLTYGCKIYYSEIKHKSTYIDKLVQLQRSIIRTICGAYKHTNSIKLLEICNLVSIEKELNYQLNVNNLDKESRKIKLNQLRENEIKERVKLLNLGDDFSFESIKRKETIWFVVNCGPFKEFLYKIKKADDDLCRFCGICKENSEHLISDCVVIGCELKENYDAVDFENKVQMVYKLLLKKGI